MRRTHQMSLVASALLADPDAPHYGRAIQRTTGIASGCLYPLLSRLVDAGWLSPEWENSVTAHATGRPPRRYLRLTDVGRAELPRMVRP